ncbi:putative transposase, Ptta/En/Spm, plant [Sesbania bispinosa]|nr:putative transposase, Ptta/En/Spm, plant [Sesbania bispinosa]
MGIRKNLHLKETCDAKKFNQIKREKIDSLHKKLQGNGRGNIEHVDLTKKQNKVVKNVPLSSMMSQAQEQKKVSSDTFVSRMQVSNQKDGHPENSKDHMKNKGKRKATCLTNDIDDFISSLRDSHEGGNELVQRKSLQEKTNDPQAKSTFQTKVKVRQDNSGIKENCSGKKENMKKKIRRSATCPGMEIDDFIEENEPVRLQKSQSNKEAHDVREEDLRQPEIELAESNKETGEGTSKKRTRGSTKCNKIHSRSMEEREEVTFNVEGQPIGPSDEAVSNLSLFLGTFARNAAFCPLTYTSWKALPDENKKEVWNYTNKKFILPTEAKAWVDTAVRDAWRRYKHLIKKNHFDKYSNMKQRLKHRPVNVPEPHFKKLCDYWSLETVQSISQRNTISRAKQKWRHRMGPRSFALIREKLRAKDNRDPSQAEVFIETRKGNKGKQLDEDTDNVITQLQEMIENDDGNNDEVFQVVFGKEHPGAVRCYGRNVTQTSLKRNAEMNAMKKAHNEEVTSLNDKIDTMSDELGKLKHVVKVLLQHGNFGVDLESLQGLLASSPGDASSAQRVAGQPHAPSSTSTHAPNIGKHGDICERDANEDLEYADEDLEEDEI